MTTYPVVAATTVVTVVSRSLATCLMPGVNIELARGLRTVGDVSSALHNWEEGRPPKQHTGHQCDDPNVDHLPGLAPVSWILLIIFLEVDDLRLISKEMTRDIEVILQLACWSLPAAAGGVANSHRVRPPWRRTGRRDRLERKMVQAGLGRSSRSLSHADSVKLRSPSPLMRKNIRYTGTSFK